MINRRRIYSNRIRTLFGYARYAGLDAIVTVEVGFLALGMVQIRSSTPHVEEPNPKTV